MLLKESSAKEKPVFTTPVVGTDWLQVTTTEANTFYWHKITKTSTWKVPNELKPAVNPEPQIKFAETFVNRPVQVDQLLGEKTGIEDDAENAQNTEVGVDKSGQSPSIQVKGQGHQENEDDQEEINLPIEQRIGLFKTLLSEININPFHPFEVSLPEFDTDPRFHLLSATARREAFDEYCRDKARDLRQASATEGRKAQNPKEDFEQLLKDHVTSTRTSWTAFRKEWKKDRRFYGWGRDDREREKRFRDYLKDLGETKREAMHKTKTDFFALLNDTDKRKENTWKEIKRIICEDPRYIAVGSSSLREELFNTYMKDLVSSHSSPNFGGSIVSADDNMQRSDRRIRAVQEREEKVKAERQKISEDVERHRLDANLQGGEREFMVLLTDAVRDPQVEWEQVFPQLKSDPRFNTSLLPMNHKIRLFHYHVAQLRSKKMDGLHALFEANAPSLAASFSALPIQKILSSLPVATLNFDARRVETEFQSWQRERFVVSRRAFDDMLSENSFIDFWGRLGKMEDAVEGHLKVEDDDIGELEDEKVDMKALARGIDLRDMEKVLKNDKRYHVFDHMPDQREQWLRDYVSNLTAPKRSVHVPT